MDITLALGGGGSRGYAHIGVIRRLEEEKFHARAIAGTSAGGIIACMFAAGYSPDEMEEKLGEIDQRKLFSFSLNEGSSLLGISQATKVLEGLLGDRQFSDLQIPCAVVAVDIKSSREIILNSGRVVDAILATIAVPGIFPPKSYGEYELVDGGVLNPVPVVNARSFFPKLPVFAVVLSAPMEKPRRFSHIHLPIKIPAPIAERINHLRVAKAFGVFMQSVDIGQRMITELRLKTETPDVVIRPDVDEIGLLDVVDFHGVIKIGERAVDDCLSEMQNSVSITQRLRRSINYKRK